MKKFMAAATAAVLSFTTMASLAACGKKDMRTLTNAQWLSMINQSFGMTSYTEEDPYFENISSDSPYFNDVQTATEWNIIDASKEFDPEENLSWGEAYVTLVNAGDFTDEKASDMDKIKYGIKNFGVESRTYWRNRDISVEDAVKLLSTAQEKWAGRTYSEDEKVEKVTYADGVVDLTSDDSPVAQYSINGNIVSIPEIQDLGNGETGTVSQEDLGIESGDVYILPASEGYLGDTACKAETVYEENGEIKIENSDEEIDLYDIAEEIQLKETMEPTMDNCVVYDGNGNVISVGNRVSPEVTAQMNSGKPAFDDLTASDGISDMFENTGFDVKYTFDVDDEWKVELAYGLNGKLDLAATAKYEEKNGNNSQEIEVGAAVKDMKVTTDVDYSWFTLHSAEVRVDYEIEQNFKYSNKTTAKAIAAPYDNRNTSFLKNLKNSAFKGENAKGAKTIASRKTIKIASLDVYNAGIAKVCFDICAEIKIDGSIEITITEKGSKGVAYKDGKIQLINTSNKDRNIKAQANIEGTLKFGPALYVIGLKKKILGFDVKVGLGGNFTAELHLADPDMHLIEDASGADIPPTAAALITACVVPIGADQLSEIARTRGGKYEGSGTVNMHIDLCVEVSLYFILGVEMSTDSYASDLLGGDVELSWDILSADNAKIGAVHVDNLTTVNASWGSGANDLCTLKYKDFDGEDSSDTDESNADSTSDSTSESGSGDDSSTGSGEPAHGDQLYIMQLKTIMDPGDNTSVIVQQLPYGYSMSDISFSSDNTDVVSVNGSGDIVAVAPGNALITVKTSDGKYCVYAAVTVTENYSSTAA